MKPSVIRLLGALAPNTDDGTIIGTAKAAPATPAVRFRNIRRKRGYHGADSVAEVVGSKDLRADSALSRRPCNRQIRWTEGAALRHKQTDIAGTVASITESEPGVGSERTSRQHPWLTGTAPRGGQGVWMLSLM